MKEFFDCLDAFLAWHDWAVLISFLGIVVFLYLLEYWCKRKGGNG